MWVIHGRVCVGVLVLEVCEYAFPVQMCVNLRMCVFVGISMYESVFLQSQAIVVSSFVI